MKILLSSRRKRDPKKSINEIVTYIRNGLEVTEQDMWRLVMSPSFSDRWFALTWGYPTEEMLDVLADDMDEEIRREVAKHSNTSDSILYKLVYDSDITVMKAARRELIQRHGEF